MWLSVEVIRFTMNPLNSEYICITNALLFTEDWKNDTNSGTYSTCLSKNSRVLQLVPGEIKIHNLQSWKSWAKEWPLCSSLHYSWQGSERLNEGNMKHEPCI
jgi:hypothetical protein